MAAKRIREVFDKFYLPKADGLCGNDDCGQMSVNKEGLETLNMTD